MLRDLQQSSSHPSVGPVCGSNSGFDNNVSLNSSSNRCFPHSSSSAASAINPWGTWEDLLLASAVLRHGIDNWISVSCELQARAFLVPPSLFSAEACKVRFRILNGRFSSSSSGTIRDGKIPWFEEVRKLRVAQLKRELERYDGSIGLLQKKLSRLKAEKEGSEAVESREALESSFLASHEAVSCYQMCSAGDQMPVEQSLGAGSLLDINLRESSCATTSNVIMGAGGGGGGVKETILLFDPKESLTVKDADQNLSSGAHVVDNSLQNDDHNMHLGSISDQSLTSPDHHVHSGSILDKKLSACLHLHGVNRPSTIEVHHKPCYSPDYPFSIVEDKRSSVKIEDAELESKVQDGAMPLYMENKVLNQKLLVQNSESEASVIGHQDDHSSVLVQEREVYDSGFTELEDGGAALEDTGCLCRPLGLDGLVVNDVTCTARDLGVHVNYSHAPPVDDAGCAKSESANALPSQAMKVSDDVLKEDYVVSDCLVSASAMDLLRIAYADGTPVSTPEEAEIQPAELERTEKLDHSVIPGGFCPPLNQEFATCKPDLLFGNLAQVPGEHVPGELQRSKQNLALEIQMTVNKGLESVTSRQIGLLKPASVSGLEHSSEQIDYQGMGVLSSNLSEITLYPNLGEGTVVENADTGQPQIAGGHSLISEKNPSFILGPANNWDVLSADIPREGSTLHAVQDSRKRAWSASSDCLEIFQEETECSEKSTGVVLAEDVVEKANSKIMSEDVNFPAKIESVAHNLSKPDSHMLISGEHSAVSFNDRQECSQTCMGGFQSVVEMKKESFNSAIHCENGTSEPVSLGCDSHFVCGSLDISHQKLNNMSCHSDVRNFVLQPLFELTNKQQAPNPDCAISDSLGKGTLKAKCCPTERIFSELKSDFTMTSNKQARFEEHSKQFASRKSSRAVGSSRPLLKVKHKADAETLEEDGLLVDLMKLKETDLTTLRRRKQLKRGGNNVENFEDYSRSRDELGEFSENKHLKLSRCQEEDGNKTLLPATQKNAKSYSGDSSGQAAISSTVSSLDSHRGFGTKESAAGVFSTRRSYLKLRKNNSQKEEPNKIRRRNVGIVQKFEATAVKAADEEASDLEISGVLPVVNNVETRTDSNGLLPELLILLECLRSISGHRFAPLFKVRPEIQSDARYRCLVKRPMDFDTVRTKLEEGTYSESLEFFRDMMLIFSNVLVFSSRDSQEYGAALVLRESLMRELEVFLREESLYRSKVATQAVKCSSESKALQSMNIGCSVTNYDGKRQAFPKSSCDPTICGTGLHGDNGAHKEVLCTKIAAQESGSGNSTFVKELDCKKKHSGDLASSKALLKTRLARTKADGVEGDRLNLDLVKIGRDKRSRNLENAASTVSTAVDLSQVLRKSHQLSSQNSRKYTPRKDSSSRSRSSNYSSERPCLSSSQGRQESRERLGGVGRLSRSAQQSKQAHFRGAQSYCQPQKHSGICTSLYLVFDNYMLLMSLTRMLQFSGGFVFTNMVQFSAGRGMGGLLLQYGAWGEGSWLLARLDAGQPGFDLVEIL
ncbi:hypothetical protein L7F22_033677 [Adiantum nelumboides]|nr:hypothetical protein [Adiantum nelumboides]